MRALSKSILVCLAFLALSAPAQAYVDPNSGGLLFQLLTPIIALVTAGATFARERIARGWYSFLRTTKGLVDRIARSSNRDAK
jgi:hypothetical protein